MTRPGGTGVGESPRWRRRPDTLWRRGLDTVVLLPAGADEPITLGGSGPALWELLIEPGTVAQLAEVLAAAYAVDAAMVADDIAPVIEQLIALGALEPA